MFYAKRAHNMLQNTCNFYVFFSGNRSKIIFNVYITHPYNTCFTLNVYNIKQ